MKTFILALLLSLAWNLGFTQYQGKSNEYLKHQLSMTQPDTIRVQLMARLCYNYSGTNPDSAKLLGEQALALSRKINYKLGEAVALTNLGRNYGNRGEASKALKLLFDALQISEAYQYKNQAALSLNFIGTMYDALQQYQTAKYYFLKSEETAKNLNLFWRLSLDLNIGEVYRNLNQLDSAQIYLQNAMEEFKSSPIAGTSGGSLLYLLGQIQYDLGNHQMGLDTMRKNYSVFATSPQSKAKAGNIIAKFYKEMNQPDSAILYAKNALNEAYKIDNNISKLKSAELLAELYELKDPKQALHYQKIAKAANSELYGIKKIQELQNIISDEQQRQREIENQKTIYQNQLKQYTLLAGLVILFLIGLILYRNNLQKHKANNLLQEQKDEVDKTLSQLKTTQSQLIQSEKMASLGELTAGIAHEIQNPLNFVNNFSELSNELIAEMNLELDKGDITEAKMIASDISQNLVKINHHGKRADSIVKGMLQHSQKGSGQKEPTDINAMAEEYLRLAYHARLNAAGGQGCLAKDITLNASFVTDLDKSIGNVNLVQQDISRVLLNLYNNAFYALSAKASAEALAKDEALAKADGDYQPTVTLTTKKKDKFIEISVRDSGGGIPENIRDKIFQPFFTTKPTGQGTGLGLSLSYDIIKAHQGKIAIRNTPGESAEFIITLPINA